MFSSIIKKYSIDGAKEEFYTLAEPSLSDNFKVFLAEDYLKEINAKYLGLKEEPLSALLSAARLVLCEPGLLTLADYSRRILFECGFNEDYLAYIGFPRPHTKVDLINDFFGLLVHLSGIEYVEKRYNKRKIPLEYMRESYQSVGIWIDAFHEFFGRWGHNREFPRMVYIENLRIIRIGRLEFETNKFRGKIVVLKNRTDGDVIAVSEGGVPFGRCGLINGTNNVWDPRGSVTYFEENENSITAHRIKNGHIAADISVFSKEDWSIVARQGENSINLHIPRGERLDNAAVTDSVLQAEKFYSTYFPERKFKIFECHSWLFDFQLEQMLGENSGIVQFQKLFFSFPEPLGDFGALVSVFTEAPFDVLAWEPKTTLQRKIIEHYKKGSRMMGAGAFRLPESDIQQDR